MKTRDRESALPFVLPAVILLAFVTIYPLLYVFWLSLQRRLLIFDISRFCGLETTAFS
jgi:ABC-type sugar transport system permease subunit